MTDKKIPEGQLFSRVYLLRNQPLRDSQRFRTRLSGYFNEHFWDLRNEFASAIQRELGAVVQVSELNTPVKTFMYNIPMFLASAELRDILDSISLIIPILRTKELSHQIEPYLSFVARALREEGMGYKLDSQGGIHYIVDDEFEHNKLSAIACLNGEKFSAVISSVEAAYSKLDAEPFDTKGAVRDMFEALETLVKILLNINKNLTEVLIEKELKPHANSVYQKLDTSAVSAADLLLEGFCHWIKAGHRYRHGQKTKEPIAPPLEIAVLFLSEGSAYIRWLLELYRINTK